MTPVVRLFGRLARELRRLLGALTHSNGGAEPTPIEPTGPPEHWLAVVRDQAPELLEGRGIGVRLLRRGGRPDGTRPAADPAGRPSLNHWGAQCDAPPAGVRRAAAWPSSPEVHQASPRWPTLPTDGGSVTLTFPSSSFQAPAVPESILPATPDSALPAAPQWPDLSASNGRSGGPVWPDRAGKEPQLDTPWPQPSEVTSGRPDHSPTWPDRSETRDTRRAAFSTAVAYPIISFNRGEAPDTAPAGCPPVVTDPAVVTPNWPARLPNPPEVAGPGSPAGTAASTEPAWRAPRATGVRVAWPSLPDDAEQLAPTGPAERYDPGRVQRLDDEQRGR